MDTPKVDPQLTTTIVKSYVGHHTVVAGQVPELITLVHRALGQLGTPLQPEEVHTAAVSVRQSVRHEYVVCLDCGFRGKTLRRHINAQHGLSPDKYLARWGLRRDHPLTAPPTRSSAPHWQKSLALVASPRHRLHRGDALDLDQSRQIS